ncbi:MAG: hypothetical protein HC781_23045, partial [Leptolyngbyaceae cyanobacterium CSU_1_4]|nr:hypothetical protein [Leptolyngbyaceae cyanobacterium CSU_1_4]
GALTRPKPLALLAYLAFEGTKSRDHLRDFFWGQAADAAASLRVACKQLRPSKVLLEQTKTLSCTVPSDVAALLQALDAGNDQEAVDLYTGVFLHGLDLELPEFEEMVTRHQRISCGSSLFGAFAPCRKCPAKQRPAPSGSSRCLCLPRRGQPTTRARCAAATATGA